ncbi:hypothetical protein AB5N19_09609 [Seiridium cardinale]|uniref:Uncharacterized protein n=1 Tax=Seiridium cardinale TaxID=138064 RepID=A0ABR2XFC6_9PEZI
MATTSTSTNTQDTLVEFLSLMPVQSSHALLWKGIANEASGNNQYEKLTIEEIRRRFAEHTPDQQPLICTSLPLTIPFQYVKDELLPRPGNPEEWISGTILGHKGTVCNLVFKEATWISVLEGEISYGVIGDVMYHQELGRRVWSPKGQELDVYLNEDSILILGGFGRGINTKG